MTADAPLTRESFRRALSINTPGPMSQLPGRVWTDADWDRIRRGYRARDMDEKWNVFAEDRVVYLHRSWTGFGVFEATFAPVEGGGWRIASAVVEAGRGGLHGNSADYDCLMLELVLSGVVLGEPAVELHQQMVEVVRQASGVADASAGVVQHSMLGLRSDS
ncbi:hypothetical protein ACIRST_40530 [Kitasatospora sp. NPDC101447]|uniref:hypothetical protein n=1 Tax=Kitasatospora sp. NPDC101447 TaxID=3364102 RepID=UPI003813A312